MKNILDSLTGGLQNVAGNSSLGNIGQKISGAMGGGSQMPSMPNLGSLGNLGNLGGIGGLLGAGALGGLLGTLMSGKTAKTVAKGALVVGGTAAVGALAWNFYQKWAQNNAATAPQGAQVSSGAAMPEVQPNPSGWSAKLNPQDLAPMAALPPADAKALLLLEAMIFAARADGHIDASEQQHIHTAVESMFPGKDMAALVDNMLQKPLDPSSLAAQVQSTDEAQDLYRLSCMIVDVDHFMERSYLDGLATALTISPEHKFQLEQEVLKAKAAG